jgi:hypothetical protein
MFSVTTTLLPLLVYVLVVPQTQSQAAQSCDADVGLTVSVQSVLDNVKVKLIYRNKESVLILCKVNETKLPGQVTLCFESGVHNDETALLDLSRFPGFNITLIAKGQAKELPFIKFSGFSGFVKSSWVHVIR